MNKKQILGIIFGVLLVGLLLISPVSAVNDTWGDILNQSNSQMSTAVNIAMIAGLVVACLLILFIIRNKTLHSKEIGKFMFALGAIFIVGFIVIAVAGTLASDSAQSFDDYGKTIKISSDSSSVIYNGTIQFTAQAGQKVEPLTSFQWQYKTTSVWNNITGTRDALSVTYTPSVVIQDNHRHYFTYRYIGYSTNTTYTSNEVTIMVLPPAPSAFNASYQRITDVYYMITATNSERAEYYQWQQAVGTRWVDINTTRTAYLTFTAEDKGKTYKYRCIAKNDGGNTYSNEISIAVSVIAPHIVINSTTVEQPVNIPVYCEIIEENNATGFQWQTSTDNITWVNYGVQTTDLNITMNFANATLYYIRCIAIGQYINSTSAVKKAYMWESIEINVPSRGSARHPILVNVTKPFGFNYQWQTSTNNNTWSNYGSITNNTNQSMTFDVKGTYYVRCLLINENGTTLSVSSVKTIVIALTTIIKMNNDGTFTKDFPLPSGAVLISTESDWRNIVNNPSTYRNKIIVLTNNIVFSNTPVSPAFPSAYYFYGTIYGNGYSFVNVNIVVTSGQARDPSAFIGFAGGATLNGVQLLSANVNANTYVASGLLGETTGSTTTTLVGCRVAYSTIVGTGGATGLLSQAEGQTDIYACSVYRCKIESTSGGASGLINGVGNFNPDQYSYDTYIDSSSLIESEVLGYYGAYGILYYKGSRGSETSTVTYKNIVVDGCKFHSSRAGGGISAISGSISKRHIYNGVTVSNSTMLSLGSGRVAGFIDYASDSTYGYYRFEGAQSKVINCWIGGLSSSSNYKGSYIVNYAKTVSVGTAPSHSYVYSDNSNYITGSGFSDNNFDYTGYSAPTVGSTYGSIIDREGWTAGNQYGYKASRISTMYTVNFTSDVEITTNREKYYAGEMGFIFRDAISDDYFVYWSSTPNTTIINDRFIMTDSNLHITFEVLQFHASSYNILKANEDGSFTSNYTVSDVYLISSKEIWDYIYEHTEYWQGKKLVLTNNIIFTENYASIGTSSRYFTSTIYGNGYSFVNFKQSGALAHGLIWCTGGASLNGVTLINANIASTSSASNAGGLIGYVGNGGVTLTGCTVSYSTITGTGIGVGGLIGYIETPATVSMYNCNANACYVYAGGNSAGGLVGLTRSTLTIRGSIVSDCEIKSQSGVAGGAVGYGMESNAILTLNDVTVKGNKIWSVDNTGSVGKDGGLIGALISSTANLNGCEVDKCTLYSQYCYYLGGLIGYADGATVSMGSISCSVSNSWIDQSSSQTTSFTGAIYGYSYESSWSTIGIPQKSNVYKYTSSTPVSSVSGINNDYTSTGMNYPQPNANYGSTIDTQRWTLGDQYGYNANRMTQYTVTVTATGSGRAISNRPTYYAGEKVYLIITAGGGAWTTNPSVTITKNQFIMPTSNVQVYFG